MKQLSLIGLVFLTLTACKKEKNSNSEPTANYHTFAGDIGIRDNSTCLSDDGNLLICGNNGADLSVLKITKSGTQIWRTDFNAGNTSSASGITQKNGEIFVCGYTYRNYASQNMDVLLTKLNASGDTIWTKTYGTTEADRGNNIIATSDGNLLISARTEGFGAGTFGDIYLIKVDVNGNLIWEASYADPDQETAYHLMETQNGEYLVTGTNEDPGGSGRALYLLKVSASGQQLWTKNIGPIWKWGFSTIETTSGELIICGQQYLPFQQTQVMLIKTDHLGNVIWEKEYGNTQFGISETGNSVKQNPDGTFTICGSVYDINTGATKIILVKADENGNQIWFKKFNDYTGGNALNLLKDGNDNILTGNRNEGIFMTKTDGDGVYK
ncbi:PQQ-binding-like beta-propeller repeat protein [Fluviicola chungangensis]|uniref:PQQ-binding-like beta-propeller repeat protein n=1 Tax=Fluviicola chungangensis TaxID=2597671 RepID=A0A556N2F4_9FLAO|nr:PQQ-binding-like beta-propeller repeat protein [Fluviicola chungangensis]TSJ46377.1 PQQ-binding-like beta-propeller repeat protein [Fluviicola chungangensis]